MHSAAEAAQSPANSEPMSTCLQANPADEYMDIITGLVPPFTATGTRAGPADLPSLWAAHAATQRRTDDGIRPLAADKVRDSWEVHPLAAQCCAAAAWLAAQYCVRTENTRAHQESASATSATIQEMTVYRSLIWEQILVVHCRMARCRLPHRCTAPAAAAGAAAAAAQPPVVWAAWPDAGVPPPRTTSQTGQMMPGDC